MPENDFFPETDPLPDEFDPPAEDGVPALILEDPSGELVSQIMRVVNLSSQEAGMAPIPPLDLNATASFDPAIYGITPQHQTGPLVNCWAKILPGIVNDPTGTHSTEMTQIRIGAILAQNKDKVVVRMSNAFIGWLAPDRYALANVVVPDAPNWTH